MTAKVDGLEINYEVYGQGPRLLLLHGWGVDLHTFDKVVPALSQNFQLILPDLPGFGLSSRLEKPWKTLDYARTIRSLLSFLEVDEFSVLGHSFGGAVAISLAALSPELIDRLVLVDSAGIREKNTWIRFLEGFSRVLKAKVPSPYREIFRQVFGSRDYKLLSGPIRQTFINIIGEDLRKDMSQINKETLIIWGGQDKITPLKKGRVINGLIKDSKLVIYNDCDHFPHLEYPKEFVKLVTDFLLDRGLDPKRV